MTIEAKIIADSISEEGNRLTTLQLVYPRFIHSEFMTHRMFSRNASSSRAIPVNKMIEAVRTNPAMPIHWGANQPGMQARAELTPVKRTVVKALWHCAAYAATGIAYAMSALGAHKQVVNRILEPFQHIHVVVTATEWGNFFALRCHQDAQPEIQSLAASIVHAMEHSEPKKLAPGEWHLPYVTDSERLNHTTVDCIKMSGARCARVTHVNHDGTTASLVPDTKLYNQLTTAMPPHMSPVEHQAMAIPSSKFFANFRGWKQHRWDLERGQ